MVGAVRLRVGALRASADIRAAALEPGATGDRCAGEFIYKRPR